MAYLSSDRHHKKKGFDTRWDEVCTRGSDQLKTVWAQNEQDIEQSHSQLTPEERRRYQGQWHLTQNKAGKNGPLKLRSDH